MRSYIKRAISVGRLLPFILAGIASGSCAILPLTEDASGVETQRIAKKIKCETKYALKRIVLDVIRDPRARYPEKNEKVAREIEADERLLQNKAYFARLSPDTRSALEKYDNAAIGYDFTFTMTENNAVQGNLNLLSTVTRGTDALGFSAGNTRERKNIENFRITKILSDFFQPILDCRDYVDGVNYIYPITGDIGIYKVLKRFFDLNEGGDLGLSLTDKTSLYAMTITFTTSFTGSANPKIVIVPIGKAFGIPDAGVTASATRSDIHTVIVALSLPAERAPGFVGPGGAPLPPLLGARESARANVSAQLTYQIDKNRALLFLRPEYFGGGLFQ